MFTAESIAAFIAGATEVQLARMVIALFERQLEDEKAAAHTKHTNNVGFNQPDARRLTLIAKFCLKHKDMTNPFTGTLNKKGSDNSWMANELRKRLPKYRGQLAAIANSRKAA